MTPDVDLVNGYKISRSDPLHRIVIGRLYHHIVKLLFGLKVRDVDCDFRLMRRRDLRARQPREDQRRHLPRDDEEDPGRRLPHRRGAGAPLSPRATASRSSSTSARIFKTGVDVMQLWFVAGDPAPAPAARRRPRSPPRPRDRGDAMTTASSTAAAA